MRFHVRGRNLKENCIVCYSFNHQSEVDAFMTGVSFGSSDCVVESIQDTQAGYRERNEDYVHKGVENVNPESTGEKSS